MVEIISENNEQFILISEQHQLDEVLNYILSPEPFANLFKFSDRDLFIKLLETLGISNDEFEEKYYYYDYNKKLHISESSFGYIWISTYGLIARKKSTTNRAVNSCLMQYEVVKLLFERAIEKVQHESVYDIDSYNSGYLSRLSLALFHNVTFYIEVFCKAYLSLTGTSVAHTHSLSLIYQKTVDTMKTKGHHDSLFHFMVLHPLHQYVSHIERIPGNFKEHFIKYDDNESDETVILFELNGLIQMLSLLEISVDFIWGFYYEGAENHYLESNIYQKILDMAQTDEEKERIQIMYSHLTQSP